MEMTDTNISSPLNPVIILISHQTAPIHFVLNDQTCVNNDEENNVSVIHCRISSNLFVYTAFLSELSSSSPFAKIFHRLLIGLTENPSSKGNRKCLKYLFSSIRHRQNQINLQVHDRMNQYDEWINRLW